MISPRQLQQLLAWTSPGFPVGAYAYSHGLEYAVETGRVADAPALAAWIGTVLRHGAGRADGVFLCGAWRAVHDGDGAALAAVAERAAAMRGTRELAAESANQGTAFLDAVRGAWPVDDFARWDRVLAATGVRIPHSVAAGAVLAAAGLPLKESLVAYLHAMAANLVSAGVRLVPLGQTDGQRVLAGLMPVIETAAARAMNTHDDNWGTAAPVLDWMSSRHETQYTRIFRS